MDQGSRATMTGSLRSREAVHPSTRVMTNLVPGSPQESPVDLGRRQREVLAVACAVWALAFLLVVLPDGRVALRGFHRFPLPQTCVSRTWLGVRCPGCGLTRSIIRLAEGDWRASWGDHRLGGLMAAVLVLQVPYRWLALRRPERHLIAPRWQALCGYVLIALLLGNWLVDLVAGQVISP